MKKVISTLRSEYGNFVVRSEICDAPHEHPYDHEYLIISTINKKRAHSVGFNAEDPVVEGAHIHNMVVGAVVAMVDMRWEKFVTGRDYLTNS